MNTKYEPCSICEKYIKGVICDEYKCPVRKMKEENERLKNYNENLLAANVGLSCEMLDEIKKAKTEAIKEFAERLKEKTKTHITMHIYDNGVYKPIAEIFIADIIDNIVKEMKEEQK